jgi:hypothetical protein
VGKGVQDTEDNIVGLNAFNLWLCVGRVEISTKAQQGNLSVDNFGV